MLFNNWSPLVYISFALLVVVGNLYWSYWTLKKGERFTEIALLLGISSFSAALQKAFHTIWKSLEAYAFIFEIAMVASAIVAIVLIFVNIYKYGDNKAKKFAKWLLIYLCIVALFVTYLLLTHFK